MINNTLNIAIDCGKHTTKAISKVNGCMSSIKFRTKVQEVTNFGGDISYNNYLVSDNKNTFLIGDMVGESSTNYNLSKQTESFRQCTYLAICLLLEKLHLPVADITNINLAINMPLTLYKNEQHKNNLKEFIVNNSKTIEFTVNHKVYRFIIKNIVVLPEALGPIYTKMNEFREKRVTVIDIGSLNVSYTNYNNLTPQLDSMISSNSGTNILRAQIAETLSSKYNTHVSDSDIEYLLKQDKFFYLDGAKQLESKVIIEQLIDQHTHNIFNFAKSRGYTFNNADLVFCGGGTLLLKDAILKAYPMALIEEDSQFTNVRSFYKILDVKYGQS